MSEKTETHQNFGAEIDAVITALVGAYNNAQMQVLGSKDLVSGHRAGVRDVAVRLGLYGLFCEALELDDEQHLSGNPEAKP